MGLLSGKGNICRLLPAEAALQLPQVIEVSGDQKEIRHDPGGGIGQANGKAQALNHKAKDVHKGQRDIEQAVPEQNFASMKKFV